MFKQQSNILCEPYGDELFTVLRN